VAVWWWEEVMVSVMIVGVRLRIYGLLLLLKLRLKWSRHDQAFWKVMMTRWLYIILGTMGSSGSVRTGAIQ